MSKLITPKVQIPRALYHNAKTITDERNLRAMAEWLWPDLIPAKGRPTIHLTSHPITEHDDVEALIMATVQIAWTRVNDHTRMPGWLDAWLRAATMRGICMVLGAAKEHPSSVCVGEDEAVEWDEFLARRNEAEKPLAWLLDRAMEAHPLRLGTDLEWAVVQLKAYLPPRAAEPLISAVRIAWFQVILQAVDVLDVPVVDSGDNGVVVPTAEETLRLRR